MQNYITLSLLALLSISLTSCNSVLSDEDNAPIRIKVIDKSTFSYKSATDVDAQRQAEKQAENSSEQPSANSSATSNTSDSGWLSPVDANIKTKFTKSSGLTRFATKPGQVVKAVRSGKVVYSSGNLKSFGNMVVIKHPLGFYSHYMYADELRVKVGDNVTQGMSIATTSTAPLALQMKKYTTVINPETLIKSN